MAGMTGFDMGVALAMGGALGVEPLVIAEWLPAIEARIVKAMREREGD